MLVFFTFFASSTEIKVLADAALVSQAFDWSLTAAGAFEIIFLCLSFHIIEELVTLIIQLLFNEVFELRALSVVFIMLLLGSSCLLVLTFRFLSNFLVKFNSRFNLEFELFPKQALSNLISC